MALIGGWLLADVRNGNARRMTRSTKAVAPKAKSSRAKALNVRTLERGKQVLRLFSILRALEGARRGLTMVELHEVLEERCTPRTVYRDVEQLQQAGFPLVIEQGRVKFGDGAQGLRATPLRPHELFALVMTKDLLEPIAQTPMGRCHDALVTRLNASLTPEGRQLIAEHRALLRATHAAPTHFEGKDAILSAIEEACELEQCLRLTYAAPNRPASERVVEPHLLWMHAGRPYLVAYCREAGEFRKFALQRVRSATLLEDTFERRATFDPQSFIERGFGVFQGEAHGFVVHFDASVVHLVRERRWHPTQEVVDNPDGSCTLRFTAAGLPEVAAWIASFGGAVRAEAPSELVERVRSLHEAGLRAHTPAPTPPSADVRKHECASGSERSSASKTAKSPRVQARLTSAVKEG